MITRISIALVFASLIGCGAANDQSSVQDVNSYMKGAYASFEKEVSSYRISNYKVKEGNIKDLVKAQDLLAINITDIKLVKNAGGSISYAQGGKEFGISGALLEFIDKNEGYGADGDMRCGDVQQNFDIRTSKLLAKLYLELSAGEGDRHTAKFWELGFHIARAWKKRLCGDKYNVSYWESSKERPSKPESTDTIVAPGATVPSKEEKQASEPAKASEPVKSDASSSGSGAAASGNTITVSSAAASNCLNSEGEAIYAEGTSWPNEPKLVCKAGNWIWL